MTGKEGGLFVKWSALVVFLWCVAMPAAAKFFVEKNSLRVISPDELKGKLRQRDRQFWSPAVWGTMLGTVIYPKENQNGCKDPDKFDTSYESRPGGLPTFLLLDRGDCYFALKVWHAQNAGAAAVLVTDNKVEPLITMDSPEEDTSAAEYLDKITIPSALIEKSLGDSLKKALNNVEMVSINLDWRESLPHPDNRVEYEFWTNSNDECGPKCDSQIEFVKNFKGAAQMLERGGYTLFTPHYITWYCPESFVLSKQCKSQCINHGRYCAPDPEHDFSQGYDGKDVVVENLRQLCVFKVATESKKPWVWWDYVTDFHIRCPMKEKKYKKECAEKVISSLGLDSKKIEECMGDPEADTENNVLKSEQDAQVGHGLRGDVTILPTLVINNRQYRGKLDKNAVVKAICAGFQETTEPAVCLSEGIETNECLENNGGCWQDEKANITACKDTFSNGIGRCKIGNGGCWQETRDGRTFSACQPTEPKGCHCPPGFKGDGINKCEDVDECKEKLVCQCPECSCKDTWGSYECSCEAGQLYIREHDTCISMLGSQSKVGWTALWVILLALVAASVGAYTVYKYRLRSYMDSEIRAIMAQYMPLDGQAEVPNQLRDDAL